MLKFEFENGKTSFMLFLSIILLIGIILLCGPYVNWVIGRALCFGLIALIWFFVESLNNRINIIEIYKNIISIEYKTHFKKQVITVDMNNVEKFELQILNDKFYEDVFNIELHIKQNNMQFMNEESVSIIHRKASLDDIKKILKIKNFIPNYSYKLSYYGYLRTDIKKILDKKD